MPLLYWGPLWMCLCWTCCLLPAPQRYVQHPPQQQQQQALRLSVDDFERAMELLETAHFDAVKAWWDKEQAGECMLLPPAVPPPTAATGTICSAGISGLTMAKSLLCWWNNIPMAGRCTLTFGYDALMPCILTHRL